jgi:hypothetical protein
MEFSWGLGRGLIGATTTDGAAIVFAGRVEGTITRTPATIRGIHRKAGTRRITGHRAMAGNLPIMAGTLRIMAASHRIMAGENRRITVVSRRIMVVAAVVANPRAVEVVANLPVVEAVEVNLRAAVAEVEAGRRSGSRDWIAARPCGPRSRS